MPVRIGVNALYLIPGGVGGTEIYLRQLLAALAAIDSQNEYWIFTNRETGADLVPERPNFHRAAQPVRASFRPARILWEQTGLPIDAARRRLDVLLNPGFTAPILCPCPQVTVFHDLQHKRHPEHFRCFDLPFWRALLWAAAHRSRALIAVSEATRADLLDCYRLPDAHRIHVIPHGVERRFFELRRETIEPYLLCVSTLHPHKNLDRLVAAFAGLDTRYRLVIAGMRGYFADALEGRIAGLGLQDRVRLTGWIPREELFTLYEHAQAFVFPSTFEGFGMPVLEALAAGIPTACSNIPPLREVAGDAALFFDPLDEDALRAAMTRLLEDTELRARLSEAGPRRAATFTWERTAASVRDLLVAAWGRHSCLQPL